ncbi:thiamine diphosphokinase [Paenibacillus popilliae]|uniref:Thiamine diphosphokinase n=1 Tax=Paenibacillus popilliae ATCC 14706 TaxID=1212764 RepID=M9LKU7_PAEPP|nr:thiamine diphosphokinase [Paenibacillus popilliae]GAC40706.1 thiamine pyrophosphokinase [Paenibacillus popilliae ATCC 14706]
MYIAPPVPRPRHVVICAGGILDASLLSVCNEADVVIGADRGALALANQGICPDVAIGDFDSVTEDERIQIRNCSKHYHDFDAIDKDYTDTELAFHTALAWRPAQITLLGATGTRLDHTLGNIHLLRVGLDQGIQCQIVDAHNMIRLTNSELTLPRQPYSYMSLLPLSMTVTGITLKGFAYPLVDATLQIGQSLAISNQFAAKEGSVTIRDGYLLVICSRD